MSAIIPVRRPSAAADVVKNELYAVGPSFWNVRSRFKLLKVVDVGTQMSIVQLRNGKFLIIDTVEVDDHLEREINQLTDNGENIEAVIGTHPFHTLSFSSFYRVYPNAAYYGTPRHLRRIKDVPWLGCLDDWNIRKKWEPDIEMRIPAGAEFDNPQPESSNHFISIFVYHPASRTLHVDDTIMYFEKPTFLLKLTRYRDGAMCFHPSIKSSGLYPTPDAPYIFRDWMRTLLHDWPFENICCAHTGIKMGGANDDVTALLQSAEPLFTKISEKNRKRNPKGELPPGSHPNTNVNGQEDLSVYL